MNKGLAEKDTSHSTGVGHLGSVDANCRGLSSTMGRAKILQQRYSVHAAKIHKFNVLHTPVKVDPSTAGIDAALRPVQIVHQRSGNLHLIVVDAGILDGAGAKL